MENNFELSFSNAIEIDSPIEDTSTVEITEPTETIENNNVVETGEVKEDISNPPSTIEIETGGVGGSSEEIMEGVTDDNAPDIANALSSLGYISEIPEGVDLENFTSKDLKAVLDYRDSKILEAATNDVAINERRRIVGKLNPILQEAASFNLDNPNADEADILEYIESMTNVSRITSLDPEKDSEKIVREYYKASGFNTEDINEKLADLVQLDKLTKEATRVKPMLDDKAQSIIQAKNEQVKKIQEFEEQLQQDLHQRTLTTLNAGKIGGIDISREEASYVYNSLMNNEVPVMVKGKQVEMGYLEALIMKQKYEGTPESLENVMLASLVLAGGKEAINKFFAKQAKTEQVEKIVKEIKFSNKKKTSVQPSKTSGDDAFQIRF